MILVCGLGNPGKKYEHTRHNAGFMVVDELAGGKEWEFKKKFNAEVCRFDTDTLLVKPQTYMNKSGESIQLLTTYYQILTINLWVLHDDVDLDLGRMQIKRGGGSAGHHGVESIVEKLGTNDFIRFRLGVGRGTKEQEEKIAACRINVRDFVLQPFSAQKKQIADKLISKAARAVESALKDGIEKTMNEFN